MDATARASLQGRDVIVSGFAGDLLIVNDGHDARRVLRIATSPHGAAIIAGCVAYDRDDFDQRLRGTTVGASVSLEGYVAGPFDTAAAMVARVAPIVVVPVTLWSQNMARSDLIELSTFIRFVERNESW